MNSENLFFKKCLFTNECIIFRNKAHISTKYRVECMKKLKHLYEIWSNIQNLEKHKKQNTNFKKLISPIHQEV